MLTSILGFNLPGCVFCRSDGSLMNNIHVGLQVRRDPVELVKADATEARGSSTSRRSIETIIMTSADRQSTASPAIASSISRGAT